MRRAAVAHLLPLPAGRRDAKAGRRPSYAAGRVPAARGAVQEDLFPPNGCARLRSYSTIYSCNSTVVSLNKYFNNLTMHNGFLTRAGAQLQGSVAQQKTSSEEAARRLTRR